MRSTRSKSNVKVALSSTSQSIMIITLFAVKLEFSLNWPSGGEGEEGGTSLKEANGDVPLDGVAFSRLD